MTSATPDDFQQLLPFLNLSRPTENAAATEKQNLPDPPVTLDDLLSRHAPLKAPKRKLEVKEGSTQDARGTAPLAGGPEEARSVLVKQEQQPVHRPVQAPALPEETIELAGNLSSYGQGFFKALSFETPRTQAKEAPGEALRDQSSFQGGAAARAPSFPGSSMGLLSNIGELLEMTESDLAEKLSPSWTDEDQHLLAKIEKNPDLLRAYQIGQEIGKAQAIYDYIVAIKKEKESSSASESKILRSNTESSGKQESAPAVGDRRPTEIAPEAEAELMPSLTTSFGSRGQPTAEEKNQGQLLSTGQNPWDSLPLAGDSSGSTSSPLTSSNWPAGTLGGLLPSSIAPQSPPPICSPPKKPLMAYIHFCSQTMKDHPALFQGKSATDRSKMIAVIWNQLTPEQKAPFVERERADRMRYKRELEEYERLGLDRSSPAAESGGQLRLQNRLPKIKKWGPVQPFSSAAVSSSSLVRKKTSRVPSAYNLFRRERLPMLTSNGLDLAEANRQLLLIWTNMPSRERSRYDQLVNEIEEGHHQP